VIGALLAWSAAPSAPILPKGRSESGPRLSQSVSYPSCAGPTARSLPPSVARGTRRTLDVVAGPVTTIRRDSALAGLPRNPLQLASIGLPPRLAARGHVVIALPQTDGPVDEFPHDVGVAGMPMGLGDHMDEDPVQCHLAAVVRLPGHVARRIQRQSLNRGIRVGVVTLTSARHMMWGIRPHFWPEMHAQWQETGRKPASSGEWATNICPNGRSCDNAPTTGAPAGASPVSDPQTPGGAQP